MASPPTILVRPVTTLGVSQLLLLLRDPAGGETEALRCPGTAAAQITAEIKRRAAAAEGALPGVLVDLEFCEWVDSGVLGIWVSWHHALSKQGGHVVICRANDRIRNILRVSQLDHLFTLCGTLDEGLADLGA